MIEVPEKGRDTTRAGRTSGPTGWNSLGRRSVSHPSASECLGFAPEANSQVYRVSRSLPVGFALWTQEYLCVSVDICGYFHGHGRIRSSSRTTSTRAGRSSSRTISRSSRSASTGPTALAVRKRRRAPIAAATTGGSGGLPPTRPAEPHPEGRHRERGKPQWRLNVSLSTYWFAVDGVQGSQLTPLYSILPATPPCGVSDGDGWRLSRSTYRIGVSR
jgi:hypothetical protein